MIGGITPRPLFLTTAELVALHQEYLQTIKPYVDHLVRIYAVLPQPPLMWNRDLDRLEPMERELPAWARLSVDTMNEAIQGIHAEFQRRGLNALRKTE